MGATYLKRRVTASMPSLPLLNFEMDSDSVLYVSVLYMCMYMYLPIPVVVHPVHKLQIDVLCTVVSVWKRADSIHT